MKELKQKLRIEVAQKKKSFCASSLYRLSQEALNRLEAHPQFQNAYTILLYYSLPDEVYTHEFIEKWYKQKQIILPVVVGDELELRLYRGKDQLKVGAFNILEPDYGEYTDYTKIDLAIIPGVGFDKAGNRLGRGKGYYDRLLPMLGCYKIGLCFPFQLYATIPTEPLDMKMDEIIY